MAIVGTVLVVSGLFGNFAHNHWHLYGFASCSKQLRGRL